MATLFMILYFILFVPMPSSSFSFSSSRSDSLSAGSSLFVEKPNFDVLTSPDGIFSAGFHPVGKNAYCFAVWFSEPPSANDENRTVVWMANRDQPVNGKRSKLSLLKNSNLILNDAGQNVVWETRSATASSSHSDSVAELKLLNSGNLVLVRNSQDGVVLWQSFDSPTDTLLPGQPLTGQTKLISSRSQTNVSSGFYKLFFDTDNVLRLVYESTELSSVYWPPPWLVSWEVGRSTYDNRRMAVLDSLGNFSSTDNFTFISSDYGDQRVQIRRLRIDHDGNVRVYSRQSSNDNHIKWVVSWLAFSDSCKIHGVCGANSFCTYNPISGRKCSCIPGHKMRNHTDWSYGCEPEFEFSFLQNESNNNFLKLLNTEFYGYDYDFFPNYTFRACKDFCLKSSKCVGFQFKFINMPRGYKINFNCYPKTLLVNGYKSSTFFGDFYLRYPKKKYSYYSYHDQNNSSDHDDEFGLSCSNEKVATIHLDRTYTKKSYANIELAIKFIRWFATGMGGFEVILFLSVWRFLSIRTEQNYSGSDYNNYLLAATGFKRFSFTELKKATQGFAKEIGKGAAGTVYRGVLSDSRIAAIKRLSESNSQGEAEFLAEVNTIGKLNHMNLIDMWGYCVQGKHRLLVYEYMEHGSLAENLAKHSNALDWKKRFQIALGTAKSLAYLHDECLEWVLHCDVKPQNILLGSDYQPKVADFGLSKLLKRQDRPRFSKIRGTRGYMAPEWVTNQHITSKADVYSYGIVVLEMLTGKSPSATEDMEDRVLVNWVREKVNYGTTCETMSFAENIMDPSVDGVDESDMEKMGILLGVALKCVEEEKDARPTMRQVVEMLQVH